MLDALSSDGLISFFPVLLPLLMALSGWLMIKLVHFMSLWPKQFVGLFNLIGWQGQLHKNEPLYIQYWSRGLLEKLTDIQQVFEFIGPEKLVTHLLGNLRPQIDGIIDEVMDEDNSVLWENLPVLVKNRFYARTHRLLPRIVDDIVEELGDSLGRMVSFPKLLEFTEQQSPGTLKAFYENLSARTYKSMGRFCAWLGFGVGVVQCVLAIVLDVNDYLFWCLSGAFSCFFFFWLCQHWIKYPYQPVELGKWHLRSPYEKFRKQQDDELAQLLANRILSIENISNYLIHGSKTRHAHIIIKKRVAALVEDVNVRTFVQLTVGPIGYVELKRTLTDKLTDALLEPLQEEHFNKARAERVEAFLRKRLEKMETAIFYYQLKHILDPVAIVASIFMGFNYWESAYNYSGQPAS